MMMKLCQFLFSLFTLLVLESFQSHENDEKRIFELLSDLEKIEYVSDTPIKWSDYGFTNYQKLNHENIVNFDRKEFELDLLFDEKQKEELDQKVQSDKPIKIQKKDLPANATLVTKDYGQLRRTVFSFSQPIFQEGKVGTKYAFILVSQTFESEGTTKYFFLQKNDGKWKIRGMQIIGFS
ncbi:hypothetical protein ACFPIK_14280 [Algoriphagus aquatilis]|uniref:DUF3828 domain-containing protein n=1 Tax=Algoriphagus aquatilis TaxID=490186 RepID=A0ABW0C0S3_9BACT|nr:hypothetical protein [Algoriphagus sp.]